MKKLASRKFWMSVAAFSGSIATSVGGMATDNTALATTGVVCGVISVAIYAAAEAYVDGQSVASSTTVITASTTAKEVVEKAIDGQVK